MVTTFDSLHATLQGWQNFYILAGTAGATLTGLMFVAVTFGSSLVTRDTAATTRAFLDPTYMHFVQVLLTSCLLTVPTLGPTFLGGVLILAGAVRLGGLHYVLRRYLEAHRKHGDIELSDWLVAIVLPILCYVLLMATGAGFIERYAAAFDGLAVVTLALLAIGVQSAWELFVIDGPRRERAPARPLVRTLERSERADWNVDLVRRRTRPASEWIDDGRLLPDLREERCDPDRTELVTLVGGQVKVQFAFVTARSPRELANEDDERPLDETPAKYPQRAGGLTLVVHAQRPVR